MMTHQYTLSGLTCSSCVAKVKDALLHLPDVRSAEVTREQATIEREHHIPLQQLQEALSAKGNYTITEEHSAQPAMAQAQETSWLKTYKPLLLIGMFITLVSGISSYSDAHIDGMLWMNHFMAGFFLVFSFFKLLDLNGFAESYAMYDVLAKRIHSYGYIYPFIELTLGLLFLTGFEPFFTNIATIVVMGFSSIGVIQTVLDKKKIRCACLGAVFNLPMSTVTIIEDLLMVAMAATALVLA
jgi:cation transport ATPase